MSIVVFMIGGFSYGLLEILYRGYTHWSMMVTGGAVLLTFYLLLPHFLGMPLPFAAACGALLITLYEFSAGCIVNLWFQWDVWDYSHCPGNLLGQICPQYTGCWFALCLAFFALIKYNRSILFSEFF